MKGYYKLVVAELKNIGYLYERNAKGSHEVWKNEDGRQTTVPRNINSRYTANAILKQAGIKKKF
ncbi:MAG: type II toxin-antitoxin system HicA family toxin [Devosiaceae bacterium]|nr:type II toxin-antitoxin system HicA family toxin [Devosiaceae bacterium]